MKKLINSPETYVANALWGFAGAHKGLVEVDLGHSLVARAIPTPGKVGLVSGGGSGHEPLHLGFVGQGMLDVACVGQIFTSPVPEQILRASQLAHTGAGVLHVVKNYTGDRLAFRLSLELTEEQNIPVETVVINDECAVEDRPGTAGRRGTGATLLAQKIAGAKAETGASLEEVAHVARKVNAQARSFGVAFSSCVNPSLGRAIFDLGKGEIEVGVGIHGEPGRQREHWAPAAELTERMLGHILEDLAPPRGCEVLALVNGLGGTPLGELYLLFYELERQLVAQGIRVARSLVGSFVTSLEMAGASLTLLVLDKELTELWDAPVHTAALRWGI